MVRPGAADVDFVLQSHTLEGDMDADCDVDIVDIMLVASHWGSMQGGAN